MSSKTLFEQIGSEFIQKAITEFYRRAPLDGIIGHFFFEKDIEHITAMQIDFATAMLGGPRTYHGKPLATAHAGLAIRPPHFGRRQVLMREVLDDYGLAPDLRDAWLAAEEALRPIILRQR